MHLVLHPCITMVIMATITITRVMTTIGIQVWLLLLLLHIFLCLNPDTVLHLHPGVHTAETSHRKEALLHQLLSLQLTITILLPLPCLHIHGHLHLLVVLHVIPVCMGDPLFLPLPFYQSHPCLPFLLLMHILQANMGQGQVLRRVNRRHQQALPGCRNWHLHLIPPTAPGWCRGVVICGAGSLLSSHYYVPK